MYIFRESILRIQIEHRNFQWLLYILFSEFFYLYSERICVAHCFHLIQFGFVSPCQSINAQTFRRYRAEKIEIVEFEFTVTVNRQLLI